MMDWDKFADGTAAQYSIKKPKTSRYPSLKGTDPKFRRNHRYVLHGTMKALVSNSDLISSPSSDSPRGRKRARD